jgi:hypothetical protein
MSRTCHWRVLLLLVTLGIMLAASLAVAQRGSVRYAPNRPYRQRGGYDYGQGWSNTAFYHAPLVYGSDLSNPANLSSQDLRRGPQPEFYEPDDSAPRLGMPYYDSGLAAEAAPARPAAAAARTGFGEYGDWGDDQRVNLDTDTDRFWWGNPDLAEGATVTQLPAEAAALAVGSAAYRYADGVYLQAQDAGYVVVAAPVGAVVITLPPGNTMVMLGSALYFYCNGVFYQQVAGGYAVVAAPSGAVVPTLPEGATIQAEGNTHYFLHHGTRYQPVMLNGNAVFRVR